MAGSFWDSIVRSHLDAPIDQHFGQPVTIRPMTKSPNGRTSVDLGRAVVNCTAVFSRRPHQPSVAMGNRPTGRHGKNDMHSILQGSIPKLSVPDSAFPPGEQPRQGDRVNVSDEHFEIVSAPHDGTSRFILQLVAIGGAT